MILVRPHKDVPSEEMELAEFERRSRLGEIAPQHEVCFPAVTGHRFVKARELELYRGLYAAGTITFRRYFHLARFPWLTIGVIALLVATFFFWQGGRIDNTDELVRLGAKSRTLIIELGQWWRMGTANLLHVSGWHLVVNCVFLLNLGGPTEAIFRRLDYLLVLVASALGTTSVSAAINPAVSCGASGVVFGVWGAAAVFGVRHRDLLPDRYRRYFIGSVIPYSIFALYLGFALDGVDNWGHLGGLATGSLLALFLPARLLVPRDRAAPSKVVAMAAMLLLLAAGGLLPFGVGELVPERYASDHGLAVPIPNRWENTLDRREGDRETFAFENEVGVSIGIAARKLARPVTLDRFVRSFVENELASALEQADVQGVRLLDPVIGELAGREARRFGAELLTHRGTIKSDFTLFVRGHRQYVVRVSAPRWLFPLYGPTFATIAAQIGLVEPRELVNAKIHLTTGDSPHRRGALCLALAHAGQPRAADDALKAAQQKWPGSGALFAAEAQLLWERDQQLDRACELVREAMDIQPWTPALVSLAVDLHRSCFETGTASQILVDGLARFPTDPSLLKRRAERPGKP